MHFKNSQSKAMPLKQYAWPTQRQISCRLLPNSRSVIRFRIGNRCVGRFATQQPQRNTLNAT